jgi:hypothetical protein
MIIGEGGNKNIHSNNISFLTFSIELYAEHRQIPSPEVYALFQKSGLLDMLNTDYEDLHGMSFEYLMHFFDEYLGLPAMAEPSPVEGK